MSKTQQPDRTGHTPKARQCPEHHGLPTNAIFHVRLAPRCGWVLLHGSATRDVLTRLLLDAVALCPHSRRNEADPRAFIAVFMLLEKFLPSGRLICRLAGTLLAMGDGEIGQLTLWDQEVDRLQFDNFKAAL